ncbi:MAG: hypothetical protein WED59_00095 [Candidatus Woykebacteria bacterium]
MNVKEKIKKRLDALSEKDVKAVSVLLDQIEKKNRNKKASEKSVQEQPYKRVSELLKKSPITSKEIHELRTDRL